MARVIQASWADFRRIVGSARERLLVCVPYYSEDGLNQLFGAFSVGAELNFVTRLSPSDWLNGAADPETLLVLLELLQNENPPPRFVVHQRIHAKAYLADRSAGLMGSANLSAGGFDRNFELMVELETEEANVADRLIEEEVQRHGVSLNLPTLRQWVEKYQAQISELRQEEFDAEKLSELQRALDDMLGYGQAEYLPIDVPMVADFAGWLSENEKLSGAPVLLERYHNVTGQNLTGHFRQSYFAVAHFIHQYPKHGLSLAAGLDSLGLDEIFQPNEALLADWVSHLDEHATETGQGYDYAILRGILPPSLGGTRLGGGGGSSTLKRMMPLVARFLGEQ